MRAPHQLSQLHQSDNDTGSDGFDPPIERPRRSYMPSRKVRENSESEQENSIPPPLSKAHRRLPFTASITSQSQNKSQPSKSEPKPKLSLENRIQNLPTSVPKSLPTFPGYQPLDDDEELNDDEELDDNGELDDDEELDGDLLSLRQDQRVGTSQDILGKRKRDRRINERELVKRVQSRACREDSLDERSHAGLKEKSAGLNKKGMDPKEQSGVQRVVLRAQEIQRGGDKIQKDGSGIQGGRRESQSERERNRQILAQMKEKEVEKQRVREKKRLNTEKELRAEKRVQGLAKYGSREFPEQLSDQDSDSYSEREGEQDKEGENPAEGDKQIGEDEAQKVFDEEFRIAKKNQGELEGFLEEPNVYTFVTLKHLQTQSKNTAVIPSKRRLYSKFEVLKTVREMAPRLKFLENSVRLVFIATLNVEECEKLVSWVFPEYINSPTDAWLLQLAVRRARGNCSTWKYRSTQAMRDHVKDLIAHDKQKQLCYLDHHARIRQFLAPNFSLQNFLSVFAFCSGYIDLNHSNEHALWWCKILYLNLAAAVKLTMDVEEGKIDYDQRWHQSNLPDYFASIAKLDIVQQYPVQLTDFFLLPKFLGGVKRKKKKNSVYDLDDASTFGVDELPPGFQ